MFLFFFPYTHKFYIALYFLYVLLFHDFYKRKHTYTNVMNGSCVHFSSSHPQSIGYVLILALYGL